MDRRSRFAGSSTEWFLGYTVVSFILGMVSLGARDWPLAGSCPPVQQSPQSAHGDPGSADNGCPAPVFSSVPRSDEGLWQRPKTIHEAETVEDRLVFFAAAGAPTWV
jgi:hypothetical protein